LYAWGGLAGAFSAPVFMAIYFRRMTRAGCLAGIIVGSLTSVIWHNIWLAEVAYELIPAIALSALATYIVSLFTQPRGAESGVDPTGDGVSVQ
jgi:sodium/proline symporter